MNTWDNDDNSQERIPSDSQETDGTDENRGDTPDTFTEKLRLPHSLDSKQLEPSEPANDKPDFERRLDLSDKFNASIPQSTKLDNTGPNDSPLRVIIISNSSQMVTNLENLLQQKGFEVFSALDGDRGYTMIEEKVPGLILMDLLLPGKNGLVIVKLLRSREEFKDIPIILFLEKTHATEQQKDAVFGMGVTECLTKPFLSDWLFEMIKKIIPGETTDLGTALEAQTEQAQGLVSDEKDAPEKEGTWLSETTDTVDLTDIRENLESILLDLSDSRKAASEIAAEESGAQEQQTPLQLHDDEVLNQIVEDQKFARFDRIIEETRLKLAEKEEDTKNKEDEIQFLKTVHAKLKEEVREKNDVIADLRNRLGEYSSENMPIESASREELILDKKEDEDVQVLLKRIQHQVAENFRLRSLLDEKQSILTHTLEYKDRFYILLEEFNRHKSFENEMQTWKNKYQEQAIQLDKLHDENETLSKKFQDLKSEYQQKVDILEDIENKAISLEKTIHSTESSRSQIEKQISELTIENETLSKTVDSQRAELKTLKQKMENIEKGKLILRTKAADDLVEKEIQLMKLKSNIESYQVIFESYYRAKEDLKRYSILDAEWPDLDPDAGS